ncbi:Putative alpha-1-antitrypsin-related protein [Cricetulus griseus]|uniref:Putative alpha-1-antitrypsin-related protein n=1 Tax=Cricetulus griseus TaxID=10029 RepID=G3I295_CRIGR|nr:Putative alpha-1-antitrypsin-related protein [Cricetulus griseus]
MSSPLLQSLCLHWTMSSSVSQGLLLLAGLCCLFSGSQPQDPLEIDVEEHDHEHQQPLSCQRISYSIIQLTFTLYRKSGSWTKDANILFSPMNIFIASLMLSLGAKNNTHNQILEGLKINTSEIPENYMHACLQQLIHILHLPDHRSQLTIGSSLFIDQSLKLLDQFVNNVRWLYHSKAIPADFKDTQKAQEQINEYVEGVTQGKIVGLVKDLEKGTALALMNYIFFQGKEYDEVDFEHKLEADFHVNKDVTVKVPTINRRGRFFLHREEELSSWVMVKHYMGDAIAFFMLPDQGEMQKLEENLNRKHFRNILNLIDKRTANLYFPKLFMSTTYDLKSILSTLGITQIFSNEADLSGITRDAPLKLDKTKDYQKTGDSDDDKKQEITQCQNFAPTITNISLSLLQKAIHWPEQTNFVFSPVSIIAAFAMLSLGAKGNTHKQILDGLRFDLMKMPEMEVHKCFQSFLHTFLQPNYQLHVTTGSSLFLHKNLRVKNKFKKMVMELYNSEVIPIDFRKFQTATMHINKHVMKRSYGHVLKVTNDLSVDTLLALVNFISFDGAQLGKFKPDSLEIMEFQLNTGKVVMVPIVKRLGKFYLLKDKNLSSWVLMQRYAGNILAFFILPDLGKMEELIQNLNYEYLNSIHRRISTRMMTPFFSHGLLLLAGLCYLLSRTQATYEEFYSDTSINRFNCRKVALTISNFSISLYKEMAQESKHENILFSPVRVVASILMLSLGANGNVSQHTLEALKLNKTGLSEAEIHKCFQYLLRALNQPNEVSPLRSGSSVFIHRNLNQGNKSVEMIKNLYLSEVVAINFRDCNEAKTQINNHMMKKTNRKIMHMTKELKNDTFLAMMNYIIWNGKIISNFDCQFIKMENFYLGRRQAMKVPMVNNVGVYHLFQVNDLSSTVLMHTNNKGSAIAYFIIPKNKNLYKVEERLTFPHFRRMTQQFSLR